MGIKDTAADWYRRANEMLGRHGIFFTLLFWLFIPSTVAGGMMWLALQLTWFWQTFQWLGIAMVGLLSWAIVGLALAAYRTGTRPKGNPDYSHIDGRLKGIQIGLEAIWEKINPMAHVLERDFPSFVDKTDAALASMSTGVAVAKAFGRMKWLEAQYDELLRTMNAALVVGESLTSPARWAPPMQGQIIRGPRDGIWLDQVRRCSAIVSAAFPGTIIPIPDYDIEVAWEAVDGDEAIVDGRVRNAFRIHCLRYQKLKTALEIAARKFPEEIQKLQGQIERLGSSTG